MQVPSESFSVQIEESSGTSHLYLTGCLDAAAVPALQDAVAGARPLHVALDIDGLEFIDGAGWLGVITCEQRVAKWGGRLLIDHGIRKILELDPGTSRSPGR
jgi:anti-anti-sigma regulatory factor